MARTWPVIGRGEELSAIVDSVQSGVGVVVVGEAGLGKTVLVHEVKRQIDLDGWRTDLLLAAGA